MSLKHYFTNDNELMHNRKEFSFRFLGVNLRMITDSGVFAKDKIDYGTRLLMEVLSEQPLTGKFLDFGCGYGVIGILLGKLKPIEVYAVDVNQRALDLTRENAQNNNVRVNPILSTGSLQLPEKMNVIALNPPIRAGKKVIYQMFAEAASWLEETGVFYIVMRKQHGVESAISYLKTLFVTVDVMDKSKGFWIVKATKVD